MRDMFFDLVWSLPTLFWSNDHSLESMRVHTQKMIEEDKLNSTLHPVPISVPFMLCWPFLLIYFSYFYLGITSGTGMDMISLLHYTAMRSLCKVYCCCPTHFLCSLFFCLMLHSCFFLPSDVCHIHFLHLGCNVAYDACLHPMILHLLEGQLELHLIWHVSLLTTCMAWPCTSTLSHQVNHITLSSFRSLLLSGITMLST